jgi:uncharacterized Fe-S cluster protein YjdI
VLFSIVVVSSGCATFDGYPARIPAPADDLKKLEPMIAADALMACLKVPAIECRDQIVSARIYATDIQFSQFEEAIFQQTRTAGFAATLVTLGLTAGAAFASGGTSQVLSGIAAFIIGGREAFQKEVLAEKTVLAIHAAMRARRAEVLLRLRSGLLQPIGQYPLSVALSDLNDYFNAGTVLGALIGITETAGANAQKAEAELRERFSYKPDDYAVKFRLAVCGDANDCSKPNTAVFDRMKACWPKANVPTSTLVMDFVLQEPFERQRAIVARCMGL